MKNINNQQLNLMALPQGSGVKQNGLTNAGLTVDQKGSAEEFLNLLQNTQDSTSKNALLAAMKGENVDMNVAENLDQLQSQLEINQLLSKEAVKEFIAANPELASENIDPELKSLLTEMKRTEKSLNSELNTFLKTGLPAQDAKTEIAGKENVQLKDITGQQVRNNQINLQNNINAKALQTEGADASDNVVRDPRIPHNLMVQSKKQKGKVLSSGNDFVKNMNAVGKSLNEVSLGNAAQKSKVNGYGKVQNNIRKSLIDLSGANFNTDVKVENEFGGKLQVEGLAQKGSNNSFEFLAANLDTQGPKGFDVVNNNTKVLDLSSIAANNKFELIDKISAHIEQAKIEGADKLDLLVKHEDLGNFRVNVAKAGKNQVNLEIITQNAKGREFFVQNEANMIKTLDQSGVKLANFRLATGASHSEFSSFSSESKGQGSEFSQSFSSSQHSESKNFQGGNRDSERRRELWEQYREQAESRQSA